MKQFLKMLFFFFFYHVIINFPSEMHSGQQDLRQPSVAVCVGGAGRCLLVHDAE